MLCSILLCSGLFWSGLLYSALLCSIMLYYALLYSALLCFVVFRSVPLYYVILCYITTQSFSMFFCVMLRSVMLRSLGASSLLFFYSILLCFALYVLFRYEFLNSTLPWPYSNLTYPIPLPIPYPYPCLHPDITLSLLPFLIVGSGYFDRYRSRVSRLACRSNGSGFALRR